MIMILGVTGIAPDRRVPAANPCDHPYWPLRPGHYWIYAFEGEGEFTLRPPAFERDTTACAGLDCQQGEGVWYVDQVNSVANPTAATVTAAQNWGENWSSGWQTSSFDCKEGGVFGTATASTGLFESYSTPFLAIFYLRLPAEALLVPGYRWEGDSYEHVTRGGGLSSLYESRVETYTVLDADPVVIDGTEYAGLRLKKTATTTSEGCSYIPVCPDRGPWTSTTEYTLRLAHGIGLVEATRTDAAGTEIIARLVETNVTAVE
jgi:hypothetical protein